MESIDISIGDTGPVFTPYRIDTKICPPLVSALLLLFPLVSFIFYCVKTASVRAATLWNNWLLQNQVNVHECIVTKIRWCTYNTYTIVLWQNLCAASHKN